jgi:hypothetical protein
MMIFKKAIPRRTFLHGVGTTLALPLLDAMVPALMAQSRTAAGRRPRLATVYLANGRLMDRWTPKTVGAGFEFTPTLEPLAPFRNQVLVLTGLNHEEGRAKLGESTGDHGRASSTYLTGVHPKKTEGADFRAGTSADQVAARELGKQTQLASLELSVDATDLLGQCEAGYTCAYMNTVSWRTPTTPLAMENRPRAVFERLFGDSESTTPDARLRQMKRDRSILDSVTEDLRSLMAQISTGDRSKLNDYLEAIRDIERRIQTAEKQQSTNELPALELSADVPPTFAEHSKIMFDLMVLAFQTDMTRISTFLLGREFGNRTYREIGIPGGHHTLTHHQNRKELIDQVAQIELYQSKMFAYFLEKLRSTPDGDGSLLDHLVIIFGGSLSDGNRHEHSNLPVVLVGGGAGRIRGGRHLRYPETTPMTNLLLTVLDILEVPSEQLGDSTGRLDISAV